MSELKYKLNPETLSYELIRRGLKYYISRIFSFLGVSAIVGIAFFFAYMHIFESPRETRLSRENARLISQYEILNKKLELVEIVLDDIQLRDESVYRVIYQADSIPNSIRRAGYGGVNRYDYLKNMDNAQLVIHTSEKLDKIEKQLYVQSVSFDEIIDLAQRHEEMLSSMPAILPIARKDWLRLSSGFGVRSDPQTKKLKMHHGIDYPAHPGTNIFATGDGVVEEVKTALGGWGKHVIINHGFGFKTLYAHMNDFNVVAGQKVKRGEIIGTVGNTGRSFGPHLHYEVHVKGIAVNPKNYIFMDITDKQFEEMIQFSSINNQSFD